ncbi:uncharacterized protein LOC126900011 [Daktulosphaira vitifoliae]|uniref:uncharacterized protein LOC126900011 n=1 Tax=Daktulosphaira vitifoliae TaxID=58002 RepID=UPI0021AA1D6B|nr:uncharacterized protein LOC126900011 [Daktulosphaira vitifoliae]XP_050531319.1 uncharacterized protein LOC126900011 [Daktulosphaira vitifoliae]
MRRINRRLVFLSIVLACDFACVFGRPQSTPSNHLKDDVHNNRNEGISIPSIINFESSTAPSDGRSHTTKNSLMGESIKTVSDQLLQTSVSNNVDVRPPQNFELSPKGEAVPVLTDEEVHSVGTYTYKITTDGSTKPTGDLSTWVLLGGESSSPTPMNLASIKKVPKPVDATSSSFIQPYETSTKKRKPTTEKITTTRIPDTESSVKLQDSKFKNKTPVIVGKLPSTPVMKEKIDEITTQLPEILPVESNTRFGTPVVTFPHVPPRQRPSANNTRKVISQEKPQSTKIASTAVVISKPINTSTTEAPLTVSTVSASHISTTTFELQSTTESNNTTTNNTSSTVKNTSLKKKKKKKNKNKRRPIKTSNDGAQSKIDEQSTKIPSGKPISTTIYNYLAREVMPSVGVGLVGLMLTAGLAGLLLYSPMGGAAVPLVPLRRNDPHVHSHSHNSGYVPPDTDNSRPEEQVFGQVLSGMSYGHNPYSRERPDGVLPPTQKYKPSFDHHAEYPVREVPKYTVDNSKYPVNDANKYAAVETNKYSVSDTSKYNTPDTIKYSAPDSPKYTALDATKYSVPESTKYSEPEAIKYSEPDTSKYSTIDISVPQEKVSYSSLESSQSPNFEETQENQEHTFKNHHYEQLKFDASNAYEKPKYESSSEIQGSTYNENPSSFEVPKYPGYVQDVPKESVGINYSYDNPHNEETSSSKSPSDPTFSALQGVPKFYNPSDSEQISVNVRQTMTMEHGPRSLRIRRQVDEQNEIDAQLPEETTSKLDETTYIKKVESQNNSAEITSTITSQTTTQNNITEPSTNPYSLIEILKRIAEIKLKLGIEILRNTAASVTHYVNAVQTRMTEMVRSLQKSNKTSEPVIKQNQREKSPSKSTEQRQRRSIRHRILSN